MQPIQLSRGVRPQNDLLEANVVTVEAMARMIAVLRTLEMGPFCTYLQARRSASPRLAPRGRRTTSGPLFRLSRSPHVYWPHA